MGGEDTYKAVGVVFARMLLRDRSLSEQESIRGLLSAAEVELLERATASSWVSIRAASRIFEAVAGQVYSTDPDPIFSFGVAMARHNLTTLYRALLRVMGPGSILAQHTRLWGLYHREGVAELFDRTSTSCTIQVRNHSNIPLPMRVAMAGWLNEAMIVAGADRAWCVLDDSALPAYRWRIRWRER